MILQCDACGARFQVPAGAIGVEGKQVRCGRCQHSWFYVPQDEADVAAPDVPDASQSPALTDEEIVKDVMAAEALEEAIEAEKKEEAVDDVVEQLVVPRRHAALRTPPVRRRQGPPVWITMVSAAMFIICCGLAVLNFAPQMVGLRATQGLVLQGLTLKKTPDEEKNHYIITGAIVNKNKVLIKAPQLRIRLLNDDGSASREWRRSLPAGAALEGGGRISFTIDDLEAPLKPEIKDPHVRVELGNALELAVRRP